MSARANIWHFVSFLAMVATMQACTPEKPDPGRILFEEKDGKIERLDLLNVSMADAFKFMGDRLHAVVIIDQKIERRLKKKRVTITHDAMEWQAALVSLAVYDGLIIQQTGKHTYVIYGAESGRQSSLLP